MRHESFAAVRKDAMVDEELASTEAAKCRWHAKRGQAMQNSNSTLSLPFTRFSSSALALCGFCSAEARNSDLKEAVGNEFFGEMNFMDFHEIRFFTFFTFSSLSKIAARKKQSG